MTRETSMASVRAVAFYALSPKLLAVTGSYFGYRYSRLPGGVVGLLLGWTTGHIAQGLLRQPTAPVVQKS